MFFFILRTAMRHIPHVTRALELNAERFRTFDERQTKLAKVQGLKTF